MGNSSNSNLAMEHAKLVTTLRSGKEVDKTILSKASKYKIQPNSETKCGGYVDENATIAGEQSDTNTTRDD